MEHSNQLLATLYSMRSKGRKYDTIARRLGGDWTPGRVEALWMDLVASGWVERRQKTRKVGDPLPIAKFPIDETTDLIRRNIMHLVDLKRAGHSPKRTEYVITAEGKGVRYRMADTSSYIGSSAAACAAEV